MILSAETCGTFESVHTWASPPEFLNELVWEGPRLPCQSYQGHSEFENSPRVPSWPFSYLTRIFFPTSKLHLKTEKSFWPKDPLFSAVPLRIGWRVPGKTPLMPSGISQGSLSTQFQDYGGHEPRSIPCLWETLDSESGDGDGVPASFFLLWE